MKSFVNVLEIPKELPPPMFMFYRILKVFFFTSVVYIISLAY